MVQKLETWGHKVGFPNYMVVYFQGRSGGLILLWLEGWDVEPLSFLKWYIDVIVTNEMDVRW